MQATNHQSEQTFSAWLRAGTEQQWQAAITHRFVEELFADSLPEAVLRTYLVQDYQFLDRFVALLGAAVAGADRTEARMVLARQLGVVGGPENTYFHRAFEALDVPAPDREAPVRHPTTTAFNELMDQTRASLDYARCLTVLAVAEWLYLEWAERAPAKLPENFVCREWIELHNEPNFALWVGWLRDELDRIGPGLTESQREDCRTLFATATALELDFFDAAYT